MSPTAQTGPDGDTVEAWRAWLRTKVRDCQRSGRSLPVSIQIAWGLGLSEHHKRHGAPHPAGRCAGCGARIDIGERMLDGALLHVGGEQGLDCLITYGDRWRSEARAGLITLGLNPPKDVSEMPV
jgi:hypothetical protein